MRILHLPENVGGHPVGLSLAERELGFDSRVLTLYRTKFDYPADFSYDLNDRSTAGKLLGHFRAFMQNRNGYDAFHFNFGTTLLHFPRFGLNHLDLPFYPNDARKIFTYQGCDARQKYPTMKRNKDLGCESAACFEEQCYAGICNSGKRDLQRQRAIEKVARHADHIFALNPDLMYFLPKEKTTFMPYAVHGLDKIVPREEPFFIKDHIHIVHAPTQRVTKGTSHILAAFDTLKNQFGDRVRFTLVENLPQSEALEIYRTADLVVDQLLVGWYGGLAVESMKLGVPVATFINDHHLQFVPDELSRQLPFVRINKFNIISKLRDFIENREMAYELQAASRTFVDRWHNPPDIARISIAAYAGETLPPL